MRKIRAETPSPSMIVAIVALIFAVTGTAVAGVAAVSVLNKKEKKQTRNIARNEIKKAAPRLSVANATNAQNAANADKLGGQSASSYAPATTLRTATVAGNGTVDAAHSDGVNQGNVTRATAGLYCFNGLSPAPRSVVASIIAQGGASDIQTQVRLYPTTGLCAGSQIDVATIDDANNLVDRAFSVFIH
jgi:hypothetical protein